MITVLNELVIASIKAEMAYQGVTQLKLAIRLDKPPAYVQRRLSDQVPLTLADVEQIGMALGVAFVEPTRRHTARKASLCQVLRQLLDALRFPPHAPRQFQQLPVIRRSVGPPVRETLGSGGFRVPAAGPGRRHPAPPFRFRRPPFTPPLPCGSV